MRLLTTSVCIVLFAACALSKKKKSKKDMNGGAEFQAEEKIMPMQLPKELLASSHKAVVHVPGNEEQVKKEIPEVEFEVEAEAEIDPKEQALLKSLQSIKQPVSPKIEKVEAEKPDILKLVEIDELQMEHVPKIHRTLEINRSTTKALVGVVRDLNAKLLAAIAQRDEIGLQNEEFLNAIKSLKDERQQLLEELSIREASANQFENERKELKNKIFLLEGDNQMLGEEYEKLKTSFNAMLQNLEDTKNDQRMACIQYEEKIIQLMEDNEMLKNGNEPENLNLSNMSIVGKEKMKYVYEKIIPNGIFE